MAMEGGFSVHNGTGHYWSGASYSTVDLSTGSVTNIGAPDNVQSNGYGDPFGIYDASAGASGTFYAATYFNESTSYVYKYDYGSGSWSEGYESVNIYGGDTYNGDLYISGLREPWTGGYGSNYISLFDFSGNGYHDALIETGGASAHVALDSQGNVYYTPYTTTGSSALYRWSAEAVAGVVNDLAGGETDTYLTLADGEKLSDLPGGGNGITVDAAGNVFVTTNLWSPSFHGLMMWNGTAGDGDNYEMMGDGGYYVWFGPLDIEGDFNAGYPLYGSYAYNGPITEITAAVPVPAAAWLLGSGLLGLVGIRRRK
ncbi:MAG: hypothetical protein CSA20_01985 [Deltaproteobacteria bacterium]|nr:MAG: hypothetical protein CSA20_01985 [Deltaproteobacteria bacterium]